MLVYYLDENKDWRCDLGREMQVWDYGLDKILVEIFLVEDRWKLRSTTFREIRLRCYYI